MKKTLLALAVVAMGAITANAQNGAPLYITGAGDFANDVWNPETPDEFTYADGVYTINVDNLTQFKISTAAGGWPAFNAGAYWCDYGDTPGVEKPLEAGNDANIATPWKGNYTVTVAGDLSTLKLTTSTPKPEGPVNIYFRGAMNGWGADDAWKFSATDNAKVYKFICAADQKITTTQEFKIADADWNDYNLGGLSSVPLDEIAELQKGGNNMKMKAEWNGVCWLNLDVNGKICVAFSNDKDYVPTWTSTPEVPFEGWYFNIGTDSFADESGEGWWKGVAVPESGIVDYGEVALGTDMFKVKIWTGSEDLYYSAAGGVVTPGVATVLENEEGEMTMKDATANSVYSFTYDCNTNTLTATKVSGDDPEEGFTSVVFRSLGTPDVTMEKKENGNWVCEATVTKDMGVYLYMDGSTIKYYGPAVAIAEAGKAYAVEEWESANSTLETAVYNVVFNEKDMTITLNATSVEPVDKFYAIHGTIFGGTWETKDLINEDGLWSVSANIIKGEFGIKVMDAAGEQTDWIGGGTTIDSADYAFSFTAGDNSINELEGGYKITYDPEAETLTFTPTEVEEVITYALKGNIFEAGEENDEKPWISKDLTEDGDAWKWSGNVYEGHFGIQKLANGSQINWYGGTQATEISEAGNYPATDTGLVNWTCKITGSATFSFNPETKTLTLTSVVGIAEINVENGTVTYFDLQGNRIAEPANGLFIRVENGKATKVIK